MQSNRSTRLRLARQVTLALMCCAAIAAAAATPAAQKKKGADPFAAYVWPPPPDQPQIKLETIITGRADVEGSSSFSKRLIGAGPQGPYDRLNRPVGIAYDAEGRILAADQALGAVLRFDRKRRVMDVLGTRGSLRLKTPIGVHVGPDGTIYVADVGLKRVVAFDPEGQLSGTFGNGGELENPTDVAISADGKRVLVVDSKNHQVVTFDAKSGARVSSLGSRGAQPGEFSFPSAVVCDRNGDIFVVDQINARIQFFSEGGELIDILGSRGVGFGKFVRPKDLTIDGNGRILVTDAAFNNVQLFDAELNLLTFVGEGGTGPGQFQIPGGIASFGDEFAVVDQLNRRIQIFRFLHSDATQP